MEYWVSKTEDGLILSFGPHHHDRSDLNPLNPVFQHSSIPLFRLRLKQDSRHSRLSLTWPRGPGFLRQNKDRSGLRFEIQSQADGYYINLKTA